MLGLPVFAMLALGLALGACTPSKRDFGEGGGGSGAGGNGGGGGNAVCPASHMCAVPPPEGWSLPVAMVEGIPSPECPATYPTLAVDAVSAPSFAPAECACACAPAAVDCGPLTLVWRLQCQQPVAQDAVGAPSDTCAAATPKHSGVSAFFAEKAQPCAPSPSTTLPPPSFQAAVRACSGAPPQGGCEGDLLCVPEPIAPFRLCVMQPGEHPCPPGYPDRAVHHESVLDQRACTECTCGAAEGALCKTTVQPFTDSACTTPAANVLETDVGCTGSFSAFTYKQPEITPGTCPPGAVEPTGSVELAEPYTFCCAK
jgi:hypothetical protein